MGYQSAVLLEALCPGRNSIHGPPRSVRSLEPMFWVKARQSLCLIKYHTTNTWGCRPRSASRRCCFTSGGKAPAPEPAWTLWSREISLTPTENRTRAFQPVVSRLRYPVSSTFLSRKIYDLTYATLVSLTVGCVVHVIGAVTVPHLPTRYDVLYC